jgi:hypothetical protein
VPLVLLPLGALLAAALAATLTIDLVVQGRATAEPGGTVVLRGTVQCSVPTLVTLDGAILESFHRGDSAFGTFATEVGCDTRPTPWTVTVISENGVPFRPGFASGDVRVVGFDPESGVFTSVDSLVLLHLTRSPR